MSDQHFPGEDAPDTSIRQPGAQRPSTQQPSAQQPGAQQSGAQQSGAQPGAQQSGPQHADPRHAAPQHAPAQHAPSRHAGQQPAPGQPGPAQTWGPPESGQGYPPPPGHQQQTQQFPQQPPPTAQFAGHEPPRQDGSGRKKSRSGGRGKGAAIGLLAGALVLGLAGGFAGAWLQDEGGGGGGGDGDVAADQINTSGLDLQNLVSVQTVADKALPSVVKIEGTRPEGSGSGSGVILSEDGLILTNYHVAWLGENGGSLEVLFNDGSSAEAEIVGVDESMDIAVLRAEDVSELDAISFGDTEDVKVGQAVVALGSPYGLQSTVTAGIISTVNRPVNVPGLDDPDKPMVYPGLQTDAAINPGNSGGALVNIKGELVGMNSANKLAQNAEGTSGDLGSIGIGWAIPINVLKPIIDQLKEGEEPTHAWLGIDPADAKEKGLARGAEVTGFLDGGNAEEAGVQEGDVITGIDDYSISNGLGLVTTALQFRPGDTVTLHVLRDGQEQEIEVEMAEKGDLFEE